MPAKTSTPTPLGVHTVSTEIWYDTIDPLSEDERARERLCANLQADIEHVLTTEIFRAPVKVRLVYFDKVDSTLHLKLEIFRYRRNECNLNDAKARARFEQDLSILVGRILFAYTAVWRFHIFYDPFRTLGLV